VKANAPERIVPTGRIAHDQLLAEFAAARKRTSEFLATTNAPLRQYAFPHPRFGQVDCYQWILLVAGHGDRHRQQIEEVIAHAGFPRAAYAN
jgi:DinB superfamily